MKNLLAGLQAVGDEDRQLVAVTELAEILSVGTEDTLAGFPVEAIVPALVNMMALEHNPDLMLFATRALSYMMDALPGSSAVAVSHGAIPSLCAKLLTIEYIDLAEQSLMALDRISQEQGISVLRAGGLSASLSYLDFFATNIQRVATSVAANVCRNVPADCFPMVTDVIPMLTNLLTYPDAKIVERACLAFARLVDSFQSSPDKLSILASNGLVPNLMSVISASPPVGGGTFTMVVRTLSSLCRGCPAQTHTLIDNGVVRLLRGLLNGEEDPVAAASAKLLESTSSTEDASGASQWLTRHTTEQWYELLSLTAELLPPLPTDGVFSVSTMDTQSRAQTMLDALKRRRQLLLQQGIDAGTVEETAPKETTTEDARALMVKENPNTVVEVSGLLPVLLGLFCATVSPNVRHKALHAILKMLCYSQPNDLQVLLGDLPVASFVSTLLGSTDLRLSVGGLQMADMLMAKLPDQFADKLRREGVLDEMKRLRDTPIPSPAPPPTAATLTASTQAESMRSAPLPDPSSPFAHRRLSETYAETPPATSRRGGRSGLGPGREGERNKNTDKNGSKKDKDKGQPKGESSTPTVDQKDMQEPTPSATPTTDSAATAAAAPQPTTPKPPTQSAPLPQTQTPTRPGPPTRLFPTTGPNVIAQILQHPPEYEIKMWVQQQAGRFIQQYNFDSVGGAGSPVLQILTALAEKLKAGPKDNGEEVFRELLGVFADQDSGVTSFEIRGSGLVSVIFEFFTQGDETTKFDRIREFAKVFFDGSMDAPPSLEPRAGSGPSKVPPVVLLISKLQSLLNKTEKFQVSVHEIAQSTRGGSTFSSHLRVLLHPIRVRLVREPNQEGKVKEAGNMVMVEPLAAMFSLEDFLWPQVQPDSQPQPTTPPKQPNTTAESSTTATQSQTAALNSASLEVENEHDDEHEGHSGEEDDYDSMSMDMDLDGATARGPRTIELPSTSTGSSATHPFEQSDITPATQTTTPARSRPTSSTTTNTQNRTATPTTSSTPATPIPETPTQAGATPAAATPAGSAGAVNGQDEGSQGQRQGQQLLRGPDLSKPPRLVFSMNGKQLGRTMTLFHAIEKYGRTHASSSSTAEGYELRKPGRFWHDTYSLTYAVYDPAVHADTQDTLEKKPDENSSDDGQVEGVMDALGRALQPLVGCSSIKASDPIHYVLCLLRLLHLLNMRWASIVGREGGAVVATKEFLNTKLSAKLTRQLQDPLSVASLYFPEWCNEIVRVAPFLFPFEIRQLHLQLTTFGTARALTVLQQRLAGGSSEGEELRVARIQRAKVRIKRTNVLDYCVRLMDQYAHTRAVLEIEYQNEVGTGLGPTLEFYALSSKEFQRRDLGMWRENSATSATEGADSVYVRSMCGLYPAPLHAASETPKQIHYFNVLGRLMARSLLDSRLLDISLSPAFYMWLAGRQNELDFASLQDVDPGLHKSLAPLKAYGDQVAAISTDPTLSIEEKTARISQLSVSGSKIEDLCLDFTLPGYPTIELKASGSQTSVTPTNIHEYVNLVVDYTFRRGISTRMSAFTSGFNAVLPMGALAPFSPAELELLFCGAAEKWEKDMLVANTKPDHGFTHSSQGIRWLYEIMAAYTPDEQRRFLQFITGSPRLPVGGLRALTPRLTIVRKDACAPLTPDDYLPSVMTCVNYLKLPNYSSKEVMAKRIWTAVEEGRDSFHLS